MSPKFTPEEVGYDNNGMPKVFMAHRNFEKIKEKRCTINGVPAHYILYRDVVHEIRRAWDAKGKKDLDPSIDTELGMYSDKKHLSADDEERMNEAIDYCDIFLAFLAEKMDPESYVLEECDRAREENKPFFFIYIGNSESQNEVIPRYPGDGGIKLRYLGDVPGQDWDCMGTAQWKKKLEDEIVKWWKSRRRS